MINQVGPSDSLETARVSRRASADKLTVSDDMGMFEKGQKIGYTRRRRRRRRVGRRADSKQSGKLQLKTRGACATARSRNRRN